MSSRPRTTDPRTTGPRTSDANEIEDCIITRTIGAIGCWQLWICSIVFILNFPIAWHQLSIIFLAPPIKFKCSDNTDKCAFNCSSYIYNTSVFSHTIISEWDLVCDKAYMKSVAQTVTMGGILVGNAVFGVLLDKYGRRTPMIWAGILEGIFGTATPFSYFLEVFMVLRFLVAVVTGGLMVGSFVMTMEVIGHKWRTALSILFHIPFMIGHMLLPMTAYFLRNWKHLQLAISLPSFLLITYFCILPESPRFLMITGQTERLVELLKKAAKCNKLSTTTIKDDVNAHMREVQLSQTVGNILDLVRTPIMRLYTICVCLNWFSCGVNIFGLYQYISQIGGNIFVNVILSAAVSVPGVLTALLSVQKIGRKYTLIIGNIITGVACIAIGLVPKDLLWIRVTLSCVGIFGVTICFPTVYIYSGELFPTTVRNSGIGFASMTSKIGSMVAPFIIDLESIKNWLPPLIFGVLPLVGTLFVFKLPETLNAKLPDTVEMAELLKTMNADI